MADAAAGKNPHDNQGPTILATMWTLTMITTLIVIARIFIRTYIVKALGPDDWLIMVAMVLGLIYLGITTANVIVGYGRHAFTLSLHNLETAILLNTVGFLFGILSFSIPKIAVACLLVRILNPSRLHKIFVFFLVGFVTLVAVICIIILFTMCDPPESMWYVTIPGKCKDVKILIDYAIFTGALSAFVDLYLAIYPVTVLWKLNMSTRKKLALSAALGLGACATAMAIIKCTQLPGLADKDDYTYGTWALVIWTNIEADVVVIASCIPTLQPLLEFLLGKRKIGSSANSRYFNRLDKGSQPMGSHSIEMRSKKSSANKHNSVSITNVESEESILPGDEHAQVHNNLGEIRRTDEMHVQYEARDEVSANGAAGGW